ncbi:MAG: MFS transporter [Actinomycetota bacterium]|nr:MFS transporter [Actinomycetota bacterium]
MAATEDNAATQTPQVTAQAGGGISLVGFKAVFARRNFKLLFWGQAISALGDWVGTLAFIVAADRLSHGRPLAVTLVLVLRLIPTFLATPVGGVLSDRWDRRQIMIASDITRFGIIILVPFVPQLWALYLFAFASEAASLVFLPARDASIPNVVAPDELEAANAMVMGSSFAGIPLSGPVYAALAAAAVHYPLTWHGEHIFREHPYGFAFLFDSLTFLVSAWMINRMVLPKHRPNPSDEAPFLESLRYGVRWITQRRFIRSLAYAVTFGMLGGGVLFALGIGYIHKTLGGNDVAFGWLMGLFGVGMVAGFFVSQLKPEQGTAWMLRGSILLTGAVLVVMSVLTQLWFAYIMAAIFGTAFSVDVIVAMSQVQARTPDETRGRVMSVVHMLFRGALAIGALASGSLGQTLKGGVRVPVLDYHADSNQVAMFFAGTLIMCGALAVSKSVDEPAGT